MPRERWDGEHKVKSIGELIDVVEGLEDHFGEGEVWYRGHASWKWTLTARILRRDYIGNYEADLYNLFQAKAWTRTHNPPPVENVSHWLCLMRHFGLPNRLLDWTYSPLIAAYFALWEREECDQPVIWALNPLALNEAMATTNAVVVLSDSTREELLSDQLMQAAGHLEPFRQPDDGPIIGVWPPEIDHRLYVQQARFTIHGGRKPIEDLGWTGKALVQRIDIEPEGEASILRSIEALGIEKSYLFPDLEHAAEKLSDLLG